MLILYNPPSSASRKPVLPMSLLALGALLEGRHEYRIVDGNLEPDPLGVLDRVIRETGADILGVTVMPGPQLQDAVPVCRAIKRQHPRLKVIWGGYFPTQHFDSCLRSDFVDYVIRGHGERVFVALVEALRGGGDPAGLPGVAWRASGDGAVRDNGLPPIPHPQELPLLYPYHRVDVQRYIRRTFLGERTLPHHSSYGCPFLCNFCAVVNMVEGRWLPQTAEQAAAVVRQLVERWNVDAVEFYDNNFFTRESRVAAFAEQLLDLGIAWWGEARIDTLLAYTDSTWDLMRTAGLKMVFLGAESGSDETLRRMNKGGKASTEKTLALAARMREYGIMPEMSFVLGNPPDPEEDMRRTIAFIRDLKRVNPATEIILYMYTPVPLAGELYERARAEGFAFPETLEEWVSPAWQEFSQRRSTSVPWLKDPVRRQIENFQWVLNAYYPTTTDRTMSELKRRLLRGAASWRYYLGFYKMPLELKALNRLARYQRPETTGF